MKTKAQADYETARATYDDAWRAYVRADERVQERIKLERACEALHRAWRALNTPEQHAESAQTSRVAPTYEPEPDEIPEPDDPLLKL